jgi:hypothetical protein
MSRIYAAYPVGHWYGEENLSILGVGTPGYRSPLRRRLGYQDRRLVLQHESGGLLVCDHPFLLSLSIALLNFTQHPLD